jgi:hypothetical protein
MGIADIEIPAGTVGLLMFSFEEPTAKDKEPILLGYMPFDEISTLDEYWDALPAAGAKTAFVASRVVLPNQSWQSALPSAFDAAADWRYVTADIVEDFAGQSIAALIAQAESS